jgi:hypothetical protein
MKISVTVDRFEDNQAVLILDDGQQLIIDKDALNPLVKEGDVIYLNFVLSREQTRKRYKRAKEILKKILKK